MTDEQIKILDALILRFNSLEELSVKLGVVVFTINRWMTGKSNPSITSLAKMRALHDATAVKKDLLK